MAVIRSRSTTQTYPSSYEAYYFSNSKILGIFNLNIGIFNDNGFGWIFEQTNKT